MISKNLFRSWIGFAKVTGVEATTLRPYFSWAYLSRADEICLFGAVALLLQHSLHVRIVPRRQVLIDRITNHNFFMWCRFCRACDSPTIAVESIYSLRLVTSRRAPRNYCWTTKYTWWRIDAPLHKGHAWLLTQP